MSVQALWNLDERQITHLICARLKLQSRGPATEPENPRIPKIRKNYKIPHPGSAPRKYGKNTEKIQKRGIFSVFSGGRPGVGDFVFFFVFSGFWGFRALQQARRIASLKYDLYDFFRGCFLGLLYKKKKGSRPETAPQKVVSIIF